MKVNWLRILVLFLPLYPIGIAVFSNLLFQDRVSLTDLAGGTEPFLVSLMISTYSYRNIRLYNTNVSWRIARVANLALPALIFTSGILFGIVFADERIGNLSLDRQLVATSGIMVMISTLLTSFLVEYIAVVSTKFGDN